MGAVCSRFPGNEGIIDNVVGWMDDWSIVAAGADASDVANIADADDALKIPHYPHFQIWHYLDRNNGLVMFAEEIAHP